MFETCNLYVECVNKNIGVEELFKALVKVDASGCPILSTTGGGGVIPAPAAKTPTSYTGVANQNIPVGATEISILNNGVADISTNGTIHPPGVIRTFGFLNPIAVIIPVVTGGNVVVIDYMI